jgi:hypothetical protein
MRGFDFLPFFCLNISGDMTIEISLFFRKDVQESNFCIVTIGETHSIGKDISGILG